MTIEIALATTAGMFMIGTLAMWWHQKEFLQDLRLRSTAEGGEDWMIMVNLVPAGTISDHRLAQIELNAATGCHTYLDSVRHVRRFFIRKASSFLWFVPVFSFWILLLITIQSPSTVTNVLALGNEALRESALLLLNISLVSWFFWTGMNMAARADDLITEGFFEYMVDLQIRQHCSITKDGDISMRRFE